MSKITAVGILVLLALGDVELGVAQAPPMSNDHKMLKMDDAKLKDWLLRWERNILGEKPMQYCSSEMGEEIGWKVSPFLTGFYYGYRATENVSWVDRLIACTDAWLKRAVEEPDGYLGWPKVGAAGTNVDNLNEFYADSMLGEAMAWTPVVLTVAMIRRNPSLEAKYASKAKDYIRFAEQSFWKWNSRGAWRVTDNGGIVTVVLPFGIDQKGANWTGEYEKRNTLEVGFSHPDNKANLIAYWLLTMFDATGDRVYRERAEKWFQVMKSRIKSKQDGTFEIWNYWEPAGIWDYKLNGWPKHWIGVHRNPGYYDIDVEGIMAAYEHGVAFNKDDINRLIATALAEKRYWTALVPCNDTIQKHFEDTFDPGSWNSLDIAPWYLALESRRTLEVSSACISDPLGIK